MLIGDAWYYRLNGDKLVGTNSFDSNIPASSACKPCEDEVTVWVCRNGPPERDIIAGQKVEIMARCRGLTVEQMLAQDCS